jgi:predicted nucleic acid-binding protein
VKLALDTNILAYAEGVNGADRRSVALDLVRRLPPGAVLIPVQVFGELFNILVRKAGKSRGEARDALLGWRDAFPLIQTSAEVVQSAADLAVDFH